MAEARARFPWGLTVACALALALLVALGVWQVQRLQWKLGLIAASEAAAQMPRVPLQDALADPEFRAVTVECPGLASAPFVELRTIEEGQAGVRLISACRPDRFAFVVLVDRGFVADSISARPPVTPSMAPTMIEGQLRTIPTRGPFSPAAQGRTFFALDPVGMPAALGEVSPAAPHMIFATTSSNPEWLALKPSAPPPAFSNNHLGYAATWFGLAIALAGFYIALLRRKLKS